MRMFKRRKTMRSKKLAERMRKQLFLRLGIGAVIAIILIGFSSWFLHRPYLQISEIVIHGNNVISDGDIKEITEEILLGKYFYLFPRTNTFIYPEEEIQAAILATFKQIELADLVRTNFQTLAMEIEEQKAYGLWCEKKDANTQDCYFLNKEGLIYSYAPNFTGNVFLRFYKGFEEGDPIGKYYLKTNNEFSRVNVLIDSIKKLGLKPTELHPLGNDDLELYMEDGSKILFTRGQGASEVLDNLSIVLESDIFQKEERDIEYIDLRFGNKVYFKLK